MKLRGNDDLRSWVSLYLVILAGVATYSFVSNFEAVAAWLSAFMGHISPFIAGAIMAYLLDIPCSSIERMLMRSKKRFVRLYTRGFAVAATLLLVVAVITLILLIVIPEVSASIQEFVALLPAYTANIIAFAEDVIANDPLLVSFGVQYELQGFFSELTLVQLFDIVGQTITETMWGFVTGVFGAASFFIQATIAIVSAIYLLLGAGRMKQPLVSVITSFVPPKTAHVLFRHIGNTNQYLKSFINCSIISSVIVGIITLVGMMIIQVNHSVVLAIIMGVANVVPFFGPIVGTLVISLIVLVTEDVAATIAVAVFLMVLQQIDGNIIRVKLFGDAFKLSPFLVIFSITIGGAYHGVAGMVFAIPLVAVLKAILDDILDYRRKAKAMDSRL